jgi:hypothetical protein
VVEEENSFTQACFRFQDPITRNGQKEPCFLKGCMALHYNNNRRLVREEHPIKGLEIKWGLIIKKR